LASNVDKRFPVPATLKEHGPARIIAMCNQKGGVGKTTSSINLAAALAEYGRKVLVVDFDPQGAFTAGLGMVAGDTNIHTLLVDDSIDPHEAIKPTSLPNLDLIPANIDLSAAEVQLVGVLGREHILNTVLQKVKNEYDVILIDCQPSLGLLTVNALAAAHGVLIPVACEIFALRGVALLLDTLEKVRSRKINETIKLDGILATMYDARTLHSREVLEQLREAFKGDLLKTVISRTVKFPDSNSARKPITEFASSSEGAESYRALARELVARGCTP
jgi:chromosome partitioning protein